MGPLCRIHGARTELTQVFYNKPASFGMKTPWVLRWCLPFFPGRNRNGRGGQLSSCGPAILGMAMEIQGFPTTFHAFLPVYWRVKGKKVILKKFEKQLNSLFQEDFPGGCYGYPKNRNFWTALRFGLQLPGCPGLSETSGAATSGDALFHQNCSVSVAKLSALAQQQPPPICTSVSLVSGLEL